MIQTQEMVEFPVFADSGTKSQPSDAKYSNGFVEGDVLPAEWVNWIFNKDSSAITKLNAGTSSMEKELNNVLQAGGATPDESKTNQVLTAINYLISAAETRAKLAAHPVGSLYWSSDSTDPNTLFGGTWERITDKFILAAGDTYAQGATGGEASHVLLEKELPQHTHTFTGTAVTSGTPSNNNTSSNGNHTHGIRIGATSIGGNWALVQRTTSYENWEQMWWSGEHTHTLSNHTHNVTAKGTNSLTGENVAHNNMPPYIAMYCWKRTA